MQGVARKGEGVRLRQERHGVGQQSAEDEGPDNE